jgi:hypothetical protein
MRLGAEDRRELRSAVQSVIGDLGPTVEDIAGRLGALGVRGRPGDEEQCVLNSYLRLVVGADPAVTRVAVRPHAVHVRIRRRRPVVRVPLPLEVRAFIAAFDAGRLPDLVAAGAPDRSGLSARV